MRTNRRRKATHCIKLVRNELFHFHQIMKFHCAVRFRVQPAPCRAASEARFAQTTDCGLTRIGCAGWDAAMERSAADIPYNLPRSQSASALNSRQGSKLVRSSRSAMPSECLASIPAHANAIRVRIPDAAAYRPMTLCLDSKIPWGQSQCGSHRKIASSITAAMREADSRMRRSTEYRFAARVGRAPVPRSQGGRWVRQTTPAWEDWANEKRRFGNRQSRSTGQICNADSSCNISSVRLNRL